VGDLDLLVNQISEVVDFRSLGAVSPSFLSPFIVSRRFIERHLSQG
jgi:hypothetical protein